LPIFAVAFHTFCGGLGFDIRFAAVSAGQFLAGAELSFLDFLGCLLFDLIFFLILKVARINNNSQEKLCHYRLKQK
jgi:hypothetical protein